MNLPEFDTFEFFGLIVPGSVVLFGFLLFDPSLVKFADPAILLVAAVVAAYILGHLLNALANICEQKLSGLFGKRESRQS
jgi:flagellar motor component MotA